MSTILTAPARRPAFNMQPGEAYTIRRKVLKIFGAAFHVYNPEGAVIGYCKQKAFKLKEDIRIYTDESCTSEMMVIKARSVIDFGATYDVTLGGSGEPLGSLRRKGLTSTFLRDEWLVFNPAGRQVANLREDSSFLAFARRYIDLVSLISPQKFSLVKPDGAEIARYRQHFNPFIFRLSVSVLADDPEIDDLVILAAGCLLAAIDGRQSGG
jgi:hypothetical protein